MHRLTVQGFLGIQSAEIELDGLTVLIGPQAAGKSVIAKLIYFFIEYTSNYFSFAVFNAENKAAYDLRKLDEFCKIFPPYAWKYDDFRIVYIKDKDEVSLDMPKETGILTIHTSDSINDRFHQVYEQRLDAENQIAEKAETEQSRNSGALRSPLVDLIAGFITQQVRTSLFVPASRSFYAALRNEIFSILSVEEGVDHIVATFGSYYEQVKRAYATRRKSLDSRDTKDFASLLNDVHDTDYFRRILKGTYERENNQDWLITDHGRIELSYASSGQQEVLPLLFALLDFPGRGGH